MKTRAEIDALCWRILEDKVPQAGSPPGYATSGRPANFVELAQMIEDTGDFERSWGEFLHEWYRYRSESFFAVPPSENFSPERRAWLGGVAEYLLVRFQLPVPEWTNEPEFFLAEEWDFATETFLWAGMIVDMEPFRDERRARSHESFLKRNVIFEPRALIAL